jgi:multiple sugar transport system permease protein/raffinose/stachyose/melibiose transport system permease protein
VVSGTRPGSTPLRASLAGSRARGSRERARRGSAPVLSERATFALFLAGPIALFTAAYIWPTLYTVFLSFRSWDGIEPASTFVGLANYRDLLGQDRFHNALLNNLRWLVFSLTAPSLLGLALAVLVDARLKGEAIWKVLFFVPYVITPVAVAAIWRWLYVPGYGLVSSLLETVGLGHLRQNWLGDAAIVNYSLMIAALWWKTGFAFMVFLAGLRSIPVEYIEAARVDGASWWATVWRIELPLLWPSTIVVLGIFGIEAMRLFDLVYAMTEGGPVRASEVLAVQLYDVAFGEFEMGRASAIGVCQLVLAAVLILPFVHLVSRRIEDGRE